MDPMWGSGSVRAQKVPNMNSQDTNMISFEGVCVNYRNPDPRRGEPRVGSAPDVAFRLDPLQNSVRLSNAGFYNDFDTFSRNWGPTFGLIRRKGTAHRQNLYTQTPDSPHACGRLVKNCKLY